MARLTRGLACGVLHALGYPAHLIRDHSQRAPVLLLVVLLFAAVLLIFALILLAAGQAARETAGQAANGVLHLSGCLSCHVLGLACHLTGLIGCLARHVLRLIGDLSSGVLRLIGHPARGAFFLLPVALLLGAGKPTDSILHALYRLTRLVCGLARRILRLLLDVLLLFLYFAHWLLLFEIVVLWPYYATKRVPILIA